MGFLDNIFDLFDDDDDYDDDDYDDDDYDGFSFNPINFFIKEDEPNILENLNYYIDNDFNFDEGSYGEYLTEYILKSKRLTGYRKVLCNLYVPYKNATTEIDIVMIHETGIYVLESKNFSGWIFGSANQKYWTQMLNKENKSRFYNPVMQNMTHITALANHLKIPASFMRSYIVFSERCELKKVPENTEKYVILKRNMLLKKLIRETSSRKIVFSEDLINRMYNYLNKLSNPSEEVKNEHIENIRKKNKIEKGGSN